MSMEDLEEKIVLWGEEKGILPNAPRLKQAEKSQEELEELFEGIHNDDIDEVRDAIGDIVVTLIMQTRLWDLTLHECIEAAYNEIVGRTGKMVDGTFVKDS